jgi:ubiquinone biosynthesis accessory factor UbiK
MRDTKRLEEIASRLAEALPPGLKGLRAELEDNFRAILRSNLERFDLISRERFEAQAELLEDLEKRLAALESRR